MGQYYYVINLDKKQFLHPHRFDDGLKAVEIASGSNTMSALAMLLTKSDEGGGGDFQEDPSGLIGSWAGDRIWIVGDYDSSKLYDIAAHEYEEMSPKIIPLMKKEHIFADGDSPSPILRPDMIIIRTK